MMTISPSTLGIAGPDRGALAAVFLLEENDARRGSSPLRQIVGGLVGRAVVDNDDLRIELKGLTRSRNSSMVAASL